MNSPLTKRRRAKNSPIHREVTPEDREGMGLGKHHGGSDSGASSGPQRCCRLLDWAPSPPTIQQGHTVLHIPPLLSGCPNGEGPGWLVYSCLPVRHSQHSLKLPRTPTVTTRSPLPPLLPSPPSHH